MRLYIISLMTQMLGQHGKKARRAMSEKINPRCMYCKHYFQSLYSGQLVGSCDKKKKKTHAYAKNEKCFEPVITPAHGAERR